LTAIDVPMGAEQGKQMAVLLIQQWPNMKIENEVVFMRSLAKLFSTYPYIIGQRVLDPVSGMPAKFKYPEVKIADAKAALDYEYGKMKIIQHNAREHVKEDARRRAQAIEDARIEASKGDAAQRAATVARLLGK
jgi:hypothetical protein